jgi:hypothetical protein
MMQVSKIGMADLSHPCLRLFVLPATGYERSQIWGNEHGWPKVDTGGAPSEGLAGH